MFAQMSGSKFEVDRNSLEAEGYKKSGACPEKQTTCACCCGISGRESDQCKKINDKRNVDRLADVRKWTHIIRKEDLKTSERRMLQIIILLSVLPTMD